MTRRLTTRETLAAIRANLACLSPRTLERWEKDEERRTDLRLMLETSEGLVEHAEREAEFVRGEAS